jgi:hypothetical protein
MVSKFHAHQKEIALVSSILPIAKLVLETGTFDPHAYGRLRIECLSP